MNYIIFILIFIYGCAAGKIIHFSENETTVQWEAIHSTPEKALNVARQQCAQFGKDAELLKDNSNGVGTHLSNYKCAVKK